jgi:hypothetical protein
MIKQAEKLFEPLLKFPAFSSLKMVRDGAKPSSPSPPRCTLQASPLSIAAPELFAEMVHHYGPFLDEAVDLRIHRGELLSAKLRDLSTRLGRLRADARDVVELHTRALEDKLASASPKQVGA